MDSSILLKNGIKPVNPQIGYIDDYALQIGTRASLVSAKNERSYGIVMTVDEESINKLYEGKSVSDYIPEEVSVHTNSGKLIKAICYNLPPELLTGTNKLYAKSLYKLAKQNGFPQDYLDRIKNR